MAGITTAGRQADLTLRQELRIHKQEADTSKRQKKGERERDLAGGGTKNGRNHLKPQSP